MAEISDIVAITINVGDLRITRAGFGTPLLLVNAEDTVFATRVKSYTTPAEVAVDFATITKASRMANAIFAQANSPKTVKIGRLETGDADIAAALDAVEAEDADWYGLAIEDVDDTNITGAVAWVETRSKIFGYVSEEEDIIATGSADIASVFKLAARARTFGIWHQHAGLEDGGSATSAVTSSVVTITETAHGLELGDPVVIVTSANATIALTEYAVASVPDANSFTFALEVADSVGPDAITYIAGYKYANCAWFGKQLGTNPGSTTWKFKSLSGIAASDKIALTSAEEAFALSKNCNVYPLLGATGVGFTTEGTMASGRFIDVQRGIDWIEARMGEAIATRLLNTPKVPYTDAGASIIEAEIQAILNQAVGLGILGPLLDSTSGELFRIIMPKVADQSTADRQARLFSNIQVQAQLAGAIHRLAVTINANV